VTCSVGFAVFMVYHRYKPTTRSQHNVPDHEIMSMLLRLITLCFKSNYFRYRTNTTVIYVSTDS
jgi:hypothetical protein